MSKKVLLNPRISINGVDLTDHIAQVVLDLNYAEVPTTAFGGSAVTRIAGLGDHSAQFSFHQDFAASSVHHTIKPLLRGTAAVTLYHDGSAIGSANPKYTFSVLCNSWSPISGQVGDLMTADVTWPVDGDVTEAYA